MDEVSVFIEDKQPVIEILITEPGGIADTPLDDIPYARFNRTWSDGNNHFDADGSAQTVQTDLDTHKADADIHYPDAPDAQAYARTKGAWQLFDPDVDVEDVTTNNGTAGDYIRVKSAGGMEYRIPAQVLIDIGAEPVGSADAVQNNLDQHIADQTNPHNTAINNLQDSNIVTPITEDMLIYRSNRWANLVALGGANGVCPLGPDGRIPPAYAPSQYTLIGAWDADANDPDIGGTAPHNDGDYWIVDKAGNTDLNGITNWNEGDWALYSLQEPGWWIRVPLGNTVTSVFTRQGAVVAEAGDYQLNQITGLTDAGTGNQYLTDDGQYVIPPFISDVSYPARWVRTQGSWLIEEHTPFTQEVSIRAVAISGKSFQPGHPVQVTDYAAPLTIGDEWQRWERGLVDDIQPNSAYALPASVFAGPTGSDSFGGSNLGATEMFACRFDVDDLTGTIGEVNWQITRIRINGNMNTDARAAMRFEIYDDNGGEPGSVISPVTNYDYSEFANDGNNTHDAPALVPFPVLNGTTFWVVTLLDNPLNGGIQNYTMFNNWGSLGNETNYTDYVTVPTDTTGTAYTNDSGTTWGPVNQDRMLRVRVDCERTTANQPPTSVYGIAVEPIDENTEGMVSLYGPYVGDTTGAPQGETWARNNYIYVDPINKKLTKVPPNDPLDQIIMAQVLTAHATEGMIMVTASSTGTRGIYLNSAVYDPRNIQADVFNLNNIDRGTLGADRVDADDSDYTRISGDNAQTLFNSIDSAMTKLASWAGEWKDVTPPVDAYTLVRDEAWAMASNKQTSDQPAPQPAGEAQWVFDPDPVWEQQQLLGDIIVGFDFTADKMAAIGGWRAYLPDTTTDEYQILLYDYDNPAAPGLIASELIPAGTPKGWFTVFDSTPAATGILTVGMRRRYVMIHRSTLGASSYSGTWLHQTSLLPPATGEVRRNGEIELNINYTDQNSVDRKQELILLSINDTLTLTETATATRTMNFTVSAAPTDNGTYISIPVTQTGVILEIRDNQMITLDWDVASAPQLTWYSKETNGLIRYGITNAKGFLSQDINDITNPSVTLDDNIYGLDLFLQEFTPSPDWDLVAFTGELSDLVTEAPRPTLWTGEYRSESMQNRLWYANEMSRVPYGGRDWLMIARKDTKQSPEPVEVIPTEWALPDDIVWETVTVTGDVATGFDFDLDQAINLTAVRLWIPTNNNEEFTLQLYDYTLPTSPILIGSNFIEKGQAPGWHVIPGDPSVTLLYPGSRYRYVLIHRVDAADTNYSGTWQYLDSGTVPGQGIVLSASVSQINIHYNEANAGPNRSADLMQLKAGDYITITEQAAASRYTTWRVMSSATDQGTYVQLQVTVFEQGSNLRNNRLATVDWTVVGAPQQTEYVRVVDGLLDPDLEITGVKGFVTQNIDDVLNPNLFLNDNLYGVDIQASVYDIPEDWDIMLSSD